MSADGPLAGRMVGAALTFSEFIRGKKERGLSSESVYSDQVRTYRACLFHPVSARGAPHLVDCFSVETRFPVQESACC